MTHRHPTHLRDIASSKADTIILVPGIDGTAELFYRQIPLLAKHFHVVAFPLPDRDKATMAELSDDVAKLIDEVSSDRAILLGESFGGALSLHVALNHPGSVKGLVIVNSFPYLASRVQLALAPRLLRLLPWGAMPLMRRLTERRIHSSHVNSQDLREFRRRTNSIERGGYLQRLHIVASHDVRSELGQIAVPALFLAGTDDKLVPSTHWARYMSERVPNSELKILEGYGHCCLINHDLDVGEIVADWWRRRSEPSVEL